MLSFTVITLFPQMFVSWVGHSILKKAQDKGLLAVHLVDLRDYATDRHRITDDYPYGGGQGMVMKPEPLVSAIEESKRHLKQAKVVLLSPQGRVFDQSQATRLAQEQE